MTADRVEEAEPLAADRASGDRGTALVTALVLLFAFTSVGVVLLARDYDDRVATRSSAQAIAFQAARVGAQQVDVDRLRHDGVVMLDVAAAERAAVTAGLRLLADYGETGEVTASADRDRVVVVIEIVDTIEGGFAGSRTGVVRAEGAARAESG